MNFTALIKIWTRFLYSMFNKLWTNTMWYRISRISDLFIGRNLWKIRTCWDSWSKYSRSIW